MALEHRLFFSARHTTAIDEISHHMADFGDVRVRWNVVAVRQNEAGKSIGIRCHRFLQFTQFHSRSYIPIKVYSQLRQPVRCPLRSHLLATALIAARACANTSDTKRPFETLIPSTWRQRVADFPCRARPGFIKTERMKCLFAVLFALVLLGCATADFHEYTGAQQNWPTASGAFVA